jgi:hypothetical protein
MLERDQLLLEQAQCASLAEGEDVPQIRDRRCRKMIRNAVS